MSLILFNIRSGSKGNCSYIASENGALLVDIGISRKCLFDSLYNANVCTSNIKGILITHEHSDHVSGLKAASSKLNVPIYATQATLDTLLNKNIITTENKLVAIKPSESFFIAGMEVLPFSIPHDAVDPVAYKFFKNGKSVSICTDLGFVSKSIYNMLEGSNVILLESNHDLNMLQNTDKYPSYLKKRILGNHGHISNIACSETILKLCKAGTKHFILGHLSQNTNTYQLAFDTSNSCLTSHGATINEDFSLSCARHDACSKAYIIK